MSKHAEATRATVAWLLWCANEGYLLAEDRDILTGPNMFEVDPETLHPDDQRDIPGWLDMADQVLAAIDAENLT
jgi:hypothetical protein